MKELQAVLEFCVPCSLVPFFRKNQKVRVSCDVLKIPEQCRSTMLNTLSIPATAKYLIESSCQDIRCAIIDDTDRSYSTDTFYILIVSHFKKGTRVRSSLKFIFVAAESESEAWSIALTVFGRYLTMRDPDKIPIIKATFEIEPVQTKLALTAG